MADRFDLTTFEPCVGDAFRLEFSDAPPVDLTLAEAAPSPWQRPGDGPAAFRLVFTGPPAPVLDQHTFAMTHEHLGTIELFIVPIARTPEQTTYEAIFT